MQPRQAACTNGANCDTLAANETESSCESTFNDCITGLNKGEAACQKLASDLNAELSCLAGLSCSDLKDGNTQKCADEVSDADNQAAADAKCDFSACNFGN